MRRAYLGIVAIVKDEAPYLEEWVAFHRLVGVERFYIYDNSSTDGTPEVLKDMPEVQVKPWPGVRAQLPAYHDAMQSIGDCHWLAFLDADEFLFSPWLVPVSSILREFERHPAVGVCWATYGTSGIPTRQHQRQRPRGPMDTLSSYLHRAEHTAPHHVKSIVQNWRVEAHQPLDPHHFLCETVDERHREFTGPFAPEPVMERLRINHYHTRSIEEASAKQQRTRADNGLPRGHDLLSEDYNAVFDDAIVPYAATLDAVLAR